MHTPRTLLTILVGLALLSQACQKDAPIVEEVEVVEIDAYPGVDEELWPYFAAYEEAAAERGLDVDLRALRVIGRLRTIDEGSVAGECTFNPASPNVLRIDAETFSVVSERFREYIVFHELGHCERLRHHREDADADGWCVSIMASGTGECRDNYVSHTREHLLDELFDEDFYGEWPE